MFSFDNNTKMPFIRRRGQIHLRVQVVFKDSTGADKIDFIYDTGAYLTVINRDRYEWYGFDKLARSKAAINGYSGSTSGYVFQIPGLVIGRRLLAGVWAFTPESREIKQNLLGDNVIEYFNPYQDNECDCFYFTDNPAPDPYVSQKHGFSLACDGVFFVDDVGRAISGL